MERIKVVLLFNEEDERQREVGNFLKSQQRCKTALITELIYDWLKRKERGASGETTSQQPDQKFLESVKSALMDDGQFLNRLIEKMAEGSVKESRGQPKNGALKQAIKNSHLKQG